MLGFDLRRPFAMKTAFESLLKALVVVIMEDEKAYHDDNGNSQTIYTLVVVIRAGLTVILSLLIVTL